jgi:hypothetical protein
MIDDAAVMRPFAAQVVAAARQLRATVGTPEDAGVRLDDYIQAIERGRLHARWTPNFGVDVAVTDDDEVIELTRRRSH